MRRKDLVKLGCDDPTCDCDPTVIYFHSACHIGAGTWVLYDKGTNKLVIACAECEAPIAQIEVVS
jgi:hypothetical protein